jgi:hypothetical protein
MTVHPNEIPPRPPADPVRHPANLDPVPVPARSGSYGAASWALGAVGLLLAVGVIFWMVSDRPATVATTDRPAVTETAPPGPAQQAPTVPQGTDTNVGGSPPQQ